MQGLEKPRILSQQSFLLFISLIQGLGGGETLLLRLEMAFYNLLVLIPQEASHEDGRRRGVYCLRDKVKPTPGPLLLGNYLRGATVNQTTTVVLCYEVAKLLIMMLIELMLILETHYYVGATEGCEEKWPTKESSQTHPHVPT